MPHAVLKRDLLEADYRMTDPGDGGTIVLDRNFGVMPLVTLSADALKTRSLADPLKAGMRLTLYLKTDGGDCVVTAVTGVDQSANVAMTFADAGDYINFESIESGSSYVWRVIGFDGVAGVSVGSATTTTHADDAEEKFGDDDDFTFDFDGSNMKILPKTTNTGELRFGNGTLDMDMRWYADTTARFVFWDETAALVTYEQVDLHMGDGDRIEFGDAAAGDFSIVFTTPNLIIAPKVDDGGAVYIGDGTYDVDLKWFAVTSGDYVEFNASDDVVNFVDIDILLDDNAYFAIGADEDLKLSSDGTNGIIDNSYGASVVIAPTDAANVKLGRAGIGTFIKSRLVQYQPDRGAATTTASLSDAQILSGILIGATSAAANYTLRTGTQIEDALEVIVGPIATNDSFELVIVNTGGTTGWDITVLTAAGMTIIGNPVIGALADVATEQESQGTFRFIRTAENQFDVIRVA